MGISSTEFNEENDDKYLNCYQSESIEFRENKYYAALPWKRNHDDLPMNFTVTKKRTENIVNRLSKDPNMLKLYGEIIADQERTDVATARAHGSRHRS